MTKKANGLGSIRETATGKYRWEVMVEGRRFSGTVPTKRAAQQAISTKIAEGARGGIVDPSTVTVEEYLSQWLAGKAATRAQRSNEIQASHLRLHIGPQIGGRKLQKLSPADLRGLFNHLNAAGLGASSQRQVHQFLVSALGEALRLELVTRNVAEIVKPTPKRGSEEEALKAFTPEQAAAFVEACQQDRRIGPLFIFAMSTGLRRGELVGLRWSDVDLECAQITVEEVVAASEKGVITTTPKTRGSRRTVYLAPSAVQLLTDLQEQQAIDRAAFALPPKGHAKTYQRRRQWVDSGRVFVNSFGATIDPHNLKRDMARLCAAAGVPQIAIHGLRHTYASLNLMRGVPVEVVSKQLGHASPAFTLTQYR